ncbi:glycine betaine ABC transporter substrate-binding protein [Roseateles sp. YR242]|uniref:glycine betaine ABC transporter substrate-binding protein n=1 Tax=Roseateles sp. YR242 TaxID=1855305 RepID=UPI0021008B0B|nr:glycine betaine ABC transporter substrate-binding protein [Roseateles sp. YR242]
MRVGSKRFTESYILAEVIAQTVRRHAPSAQVDIRQGLGNTAIVLAALKSGSIDVYAEYTGTIEREILGRTSTSTSTDSGSGSSTGTASGSANGATLEELRAALRPLGLGVDVPLGFNNGYALALPGETSSRLALTKLSQLKDHPTLRFGLSNEFMGRADGWPGLARRYGLPQRPQGLDHGLAYQALRSNQIDITDIYTTDAQIAAQHLVVLEDDDHYFPRYDAVLLYRLALPQDHPQAWQALQSLKGRINEPRMIAMNAQAELQKRDFASIASEFLAQGTSNAASAVTADVHGRAMASAPAGAASGEQNTSSSASSLASLWARIVGPDLSRLAAQHLLLVAVAVAVATLIGVPLAILLHPWPRWRGAVLAVCALLQTVPSLALLAILIWAMGRIGPGPALVALALYALLPILRNSTVGLDEVPQGLLLAGQALGLRRIQVLRFIQLPLALPVMLAGVRTATSLSVGTATMAAFIGAGGFGERIVTGLALNDQSLLLAGALPAAGLALALEAAFSLLSRGLARRPTH